MLDLLVPTTAQGLLWAVMALGVYITYRVLDIADLTVEGSFPLGAAVAASMLSAGYGPIPSFVVAAIAGMVAGVVTALLHTKMKIPALLAGILTMIALYSVNLRVMGKANLSLLGTDTTFSIIRKMLSLNSAYTTLVVGLLATVLVAVFIYWFFGTEIGAAIRATGFNQQMIRAQGVAPQFLVGTDPNHAAVFLSNLGSIGLECGYHHLVNWGTNSCFVVLGKKCWKKEYGPDGEERCREVVPLGITLDERIADGYYYSGTVALVKELLAHPELLELPANSPVEFAIKK